MAGYGGNTTCVEVRTDDDETMLILDAGTGIRQLGAELGDDVETVDILLTHLHLDHIHGLGFFAPLGRDNLNIRIWGPPSSNSSLEQGLLRYLSPPLFPTRLKWLPSAPQVLDFPRGHVSPAEEPRRQDFGGLRVEAEFVNHPGLTYGYRIEEPATGQSIAFLPDHQPAQANELAPWRWESRGLLEARCVSGTGIAQGVDLLIHDAQFDSEEFLAHTDWGHSSVEQAVIFAELVQARSLLLFHHDPEHDDDRIDGLLEQARELASRARTELSVGAAREGGWIDVAQMRTAAAVATTSQPSDRKSRQRKSSLWPPLDTRALHGAIPSWSPAFQRVKGL
jgi:ribonuclease BN (tRNA processing enzyme)